MVKITRFGVIVGAFWGMHPVVQTITYARMTIVIVSCTVDNNLVLTDVRCWPMYDGVRWYQSRSQSHSPLPITRYPIAYIVHI